MTKLKLLQPIEKYMMLSTKKIKKSCKAKDSMKGKKNWAKLSLNEMWREFVPLEKQGTYEPTHHFCLDR